VSVFTFDSRGAEPILRRITDNVATVIVDATDARYVAWFDVTENSGGTPSITVEILHATIPHYLGTGGTSWRAKAMSANQSVRFDQGYALPPGSQLRVTSNNGSGLVDVTGVSVSAT